MDTYINPTSTPKAGVLKALRKKAATELETSQPANERTHLLDVVVGLLAAAALCICTVNIFIRYFSPQLTIEMSDEVQVYLVVWSIFLALALVTAGDRHVKADLFVSMFPPNFARLIVLFGELLGLGFSLLLVWYGSAITWQAWDFGDVSTTSLRFPLWIYMAALPAGALLMAWSYARRFVTQLRKGN